LPASLSEPIASDEFCPLPLATSALPLYVWAALDVGSLAIRGLPIGGASRQAR
jgi:hypothetical protein